MSIQQTAVEAVAAAIVLADHISSAAVAHGIKAALDTMGAERRRGVARAIEGVLPCSPGTTLHALAGAQEMLARPGAFVRPGERDEVARAFTADGATCSPADPLAVSWDMIGAVLAAFRAVNGRGSGGLPDGALRAIGRVVLGELPEDYSTMIRAIDAWAAQHDQRATIAALDRAIYDAS